MTSRSRPTALAEMVSTALSGWPQPHITAATSAADPATHLRDVSARLRTEECYPQISSEPEREVRPRAGNGSYTAAFTHF